jgi:putative hydrolase of the HAD superfamily
MSRVFLFDVGNVIKYPFDFEKFYTLLNVKEDYDNFMIFFRRTCSLAESGKISDEDFFNGIINEFNLNISLEEIKNYYNQSNGKYNLEALDMLERIRNNGYGVYILSNLKEIDYDNFIRDIDKKYYDKFYSSYVIGHNKPDKEIYEYVINDIGVKPGDILFFDDNPANVEGAKELGIDARVINSFNFIEYFKENNNFDII